MPLLDVKDLKINFQGRDRVTEAVKGISFHLDEGKTLAVVGESGSGKSVTAMSLTRLLPEPPTCQISGEIFLRGQDVLKMPKRDLRSIRGKEIAYIFQEPSTSLNPVFTVGYQIAEAIKLHVPEERDVPGRVVNALRQVGIRDPEKRYKAYPHEMSGGMQQRVMIAMALACEPKILVADEPTTALDVTIQAQIMELLKELRQKHTMSIILITHNFGIIKDFADEVLVMFRGQIVESGPTEEVLGNPQHPYTKALIACIPRLGAKQHRLTTIDHESLVG
ncbi:ABC transporter ATP-binding protein [Cerasicoccus arenae]|uniref:ABC transporter ATP-binding protein n=1 Tax=Cerasicoccus arenae TaxID=424488 RepID=A0A8J3GE13_9BACT|nr:ABC transporter ATP-binding protein [Cerasicoccus arenae]GHC10679.1 ABC transporter ATP-binding protein [Cerasicoccus arenae]